jgi:hypothetical protein
MDMRPFASSNWFKCEDCRPEVALRIRAVTVERYSEDEEERPVLHFDGHPKRLGLNRCNTKSLIELFGPMSEAWIGQTITLYADENVTNQSGQRVGGVRIRAYPGVQPAQGMVYDISAGVPYPQQPIQAPYSGPTGVQLQPTHRPENAGQPIPPPLPQYQPHPMGNGQ